MGYISRSPIISKWFLEQLLLCTQMSSIVTRSQDNRVPLGCDEKEESHQGCMYLLELCDVVMSVWTKVCALKNSGSESR